MKKVDDSDDDHLLLAGLLLPMKDYAESAYPL